MWNPVKECSRERTAIADLGASESAVVGGIAKRLDGFDLLRAPVVGTPCLAYTIKVHIGVADDMGWTDVFDDSKVRSFAIDDGSGVAVIEPRTVSMELERDRLLRRVRDVPELAELESILRGAIYAFETWLPDDNLRYRSTDRLKHHVEVALFLLLEGDPVVVSGSAVLEPTRMAQLQTGYRGQSLQPHLRGHPLYLCDRELVPA